jgi:hypothetical protein
MRWRWIQQMIVICLVGIFIIQGYKIYNLKKVNPHNFSITQKKWIPFVNQLKDKGDYLFASDDMVRYLVNQPSRPLPEHLEEFNEWLKNVAPDGDLILIFTEIDKERSPEVFSYLKKNGVEKKYDMLTLYIWSPNSTQ